MNDSHAYENYICNSSITFFRLLLCVGVFFLCSCGLESYQDISPPRNAVQPNQADGSTDDGFVVSPENQQFEFTAENLATTFMSPGTAVYYRIYNNIVDLQSDAKRINNANTENTSNGFNTVESLNYTTMTSSTGAEPLIDGAGGRVIIRLVSSGTYTSGISIAGIYTATPQRYDNINFNFDPDTATDTPNTLPKDGDNDYDGGDGDGKNHWYVNAYAVSTGLNSITFSQLSSEVLSLGFIVYSSN